MSYTKSATRLAAVLTLAFCLGGGAGAAEKPIHLKLGTLAPMGSSYHKSLLAMGEKWRKASGGKVRLTVYAGGTQGSEADMVGLMQTGSLDAGLITAIGITDIAPEVSALQSVPLAFRTLDEVDFVREKLRPSLEQRLAAKGYVALFWTDSGWVRFFTTAPVLHPDDLKQLRMFCWAGDTHQFDVWKGAGFNPVNLETAGIAQGFLSGTISAIATVPLFAMACQIDTQAKYMLELNWAPLLGALVVREKSWEHIPETMRPALLEAAQEAGNRLKAEGRIENDRAVQAMVKRGLVVRQVTPAVEEEWQAAVASVRDQIRGKMVPAEAYDETMRLISAYRATGGGKPR